MLLMEPKVVLHLSIRLNHNDGSREVSPGACSIRQQGPSSHQALAFSCADRIDSTLMQMY